MCSSRVVLPLAAVVLLLGPAPLLAISNGTVDDGTPPVYSHVGAGVSFNDQGAHLGVSAHVGFLIAPNVFLTTAREATFVQMRWEMFPDMIEAVTFNWYPWDLQYPRDAVRVLEAHVQEGFELPQSFSTQRPSYAGLGILILSEPQYDRPIVALPPAGLLDALSDQNGLGDATLTAVGYGLEMNFDPGQAPYFTNWDGPRSYATLAYQALGPKFLILSMNEERPMDGETEWGGVCAGDEGGPNFLEVDGVPIAVAMTTFYDSAYGFPGCRALSRAYRLDTEEARAFLGQFVELP